MLPVRGRCLLIVYLLVGCLLGISASAQTSPPKQYTDDGFVELLNTRMTAVNGMRDLDETAKAKIRDIYQQALQEMESAKTWGAKIAFFDNQTTSAPAEIKQTKAALAALPAKAPLLVPSNLGLPQIEQEISKREAELEQWRQAQTDLEAEPTRRTKRRTEIPKLAAAAREKLSSVNADLQSPGAPDESPTAASARRMLLLARRRNVEQEIVAYDKEQASLEALAELLPLRRDFASQRRALAEQDVKQWQDLASQRRRGEAEQQVQTASREKEAVETPLAVRRVAEEKTLLAERRQALADKIPEVRSQAAQTKNDLNALHKLIERTKKKEETAGSKNAIVLHLLHKQRETLPNLRAHRQKTVALDQQLHECEFAMLQLDEERSKLTALEVQTRQSLQNMNPSRPDARRGEWEAMLRAIPSKREYLDNLVSDYNTYFDELAKLRGAEQQLITETEDYARYIDEQVLWIASAQSLSTSDIRNAGDALLWLAGPDACIDVARTLAADAVRNPAAPALATCLFMVLFYWQIRFRSRLLEIGEKASRNTCCHFIPTLEALLLTFMVAIVWPGICWYAGWRLAWAADASELCKAAGAGLMATAQVYLAFEFLRQVCRVHGLADAHFGWPAMAIKPLRQNLRWLSLPLLPAVFVTAAMSAQEPHDSWDGSLGRMSFMLVLLLGAVFLQRILRPQGGIVQSVLAQRQGGWLDRLRYIWYPLGVLMPPALAVTAAAGYYYTAQQLAQRVTFTVEILVAVLIIRALLLRWTIVSQRRLAIDQARERRTAAQNEKMLDEDSPVNATRAAVKPERDLATIIIQARRLMGYSLGLAVLLGLWCTWANVLPALGVLNRIEMWKRDNSAPSANGVAADIIATPLKTEAAGTGADAAAGSENTRPSQASAGRRNECVTLGDLLLAAVVLATTFIAAKNIPGLLEMAVLQHLPIDASARYALSMVSRYLMSIIGITLACSLMGLGWAKVQWLVTAVCVGLGFGLQEIFANFISGLIILFERPVRVRDVVTIADVTGVVSRIRLRTTTITDWDRKELIIPNKEFITGRVLNWTLSDPVNRVVINIGVAYGSDTERTAEILQRVAQDHPNVLRDPPPRVTLESFGDSALKFVLRFFLPNLDNRVTAIHDIHMGIERALREAGIEMPFPQYDVHIRSADANVPLMFTQASAASRTPLFAPPRNDAPLPRRAA